MPSLLGSHIPSRAELELFLKSRRLVNHTAETILQDLDALPAGRELYVLVYESCFCGVSAGRRFLARLNSCSRFCCWSWLRLIPSLSASTRSWAQSVGTF